MYPLGYSEDDYATLINTAAVNGIEISVQTVKTAHYKPWNVNKGEDLGVIRISRI